jgi:hypothetical protein
MAEVAVLTPVREGRAEPLRALLRALRRPEEPGDVPAARDSPFAKIGVTHFARLVVIDIGSPRLLFTSRFDGDERRYLTQFAASASALEIYTHCRRPVRHDPDALDEHTLLHYLLRYRDDRVPPSYVISAFPNDATVARINAALALRERLARLALETQGADALVIAERFRQETLIRELAQP